MKVVADESVDLSGVLELRAAGYAVDYIAESNAGISDDEVLQRANSEKAILLTADKDFGELVFRQNKIHTGVVLLRMSGISTQEKVSRLRQLFRDHEEELQHSFAVISPHLIRIRRQSDH